MVSRLPVGEEKSMSIEVTPERVKVLIQANTGLAAENGELRRMLREQNEETWKVRAALSKASEALEGINTTVADTPIGLTGDDNDRSGQQPGVPVATPTKITNATDPVGHETTDAITSAGSRARSVGYQAARSLERLQRIAVRSLYRPLLGRRFCNGSAKNRKESVR